MKKLINPFTFPIMSVFLFVYGITNSEEVYAAEDSVIVPAVIYNGETIPHVNLPEVEIVAAKGNAKTTDGNIKSKNTPSPNRYGPKQVYIKMVYNS